MSTAVALPRPRAAASRLRIVASELALWLALYPIYLAIRGLSIDSCGTALANAHDLISVERALSSFHEGAVQDALAGLHGPLSSYSMVGFGPVVAGTLVWLAPNQPDVYRRLRTAPSPARSASQAATTPARSAAPSRSTRTPPWRAWRTPS